MTSSDNVPAVAAAAGVKQSWLPQEDNPAAAANGDSAATNGGIAQEEKDTEVSIKVFSLNCWGLKYISADREARFKAIAEFLQQSDYNVVCLQEVWVQGDFLLLEQRLASTFPFSHYFDGGVIGSGTCIFSTHRLQEANFHEFGINGYPTNFWHGDWFGAKGIGVCQINYQGFDVHLYLSHYHANYNPGNDIYLSHRVNHAFDSAQWIKLASSAADLTIYAGDFNTDPSSLPYKILRSLAPLNDSWLDVHGSGAEAAGERGGETSETAYNSYTCSNETNRDNGHRIDYVMYSAGPGVTARATHCQLPLPHRVPGGATYSYSDHEAVAATIAMSRPSPSTGVEPTNTDNGDDEKRPKKGQQYNNYNNTAIAFRRMESQRLKSGRLEAVAEARKVMERALKATENYRRKYVLLTTALAFALAATFIPGFCIVGEEQASRWVFVAIDFGLFLPRFVLTVALVIFCLMGTLFTNRERNAIINCQKQLKLLMDQDDFSE